MQPINQRRGNIGTTNERTSRNGGQSNGETDSTSGKVSGAGGKEYSADRIAKLRAAAIQRLEKRKWAAEQLGVHKSVKTSQQEVATDVWNKYQYDGELESIRDVAEYLEENMPQDENTTVLLVASRYRGCEKLSLSNKTDK